MKKNEKERKRERNMSLAPAASEGFKNAAAYDTHRPAYPSEAVQKLLEHMRLSDRAHARIVEVAAGTGKLTEALALRRHEGFEIVATEPHPDMIRELEGKNLPRVVVRKGAVEELGRVMVGLLREIGEVDVDEEDEEVWEEGWADGVIAAQAFHW